MKYELGYYESNVDLDRDVFELLRALVAQLVERGVSKRHIIASIGRVMRHDSRRF